MSHTSRIFDRVPIDLPNRSGFDMSHQNLFTATCGTLIPCLVKEVLPNETISLGSQFQVQLPPMVTDFYGKVDAVMEAFFVPNRLLWGGWEHFITHPTKNPQYPVGTPVALQPSSVPRVNLAEADPLDLNAGSLADYLGLRCKLQESFSDDLLVSAMRFLAYHRVYDDWYRDTRIQTPVFAQPPYTLAASAFGPSSAPFVGSLSNTDKKGPIYSYDDFFIDGTNLFTLRQRNWSKGYFTTATTQPQAGDDAVVSVVSPSADSTTGTFTIAGVRAANSLQKWNERNNFSYRYADQIYGQFGVYPDSARMDRCVFLGRTRQTVYNRSVFQTDKGSNTLQDSLGRKGASSMALGEGSLVGDFRATEHGYLMVLFSLVPHSYYSSGMDRDFMRTESEDFAFPLLAGMGDQSIHYYELVGITDGQGINTNTFGFNDLYSEYKYIEDQVHGLLRDGSTLENFAIQRSFADEGDVDGLQINSSFLQIPINVLDQVQAVKTSSQGFSCWVDSYFIFKKVSPLPAFSLPTLADMKNTHTGHMSRGGTSL